MIFLSGTFSLVLHQRFIFEASMFWGWIGFYVLSIILLGKTLQLYLKKKNDWRIDMELTINDLSKEYGRKKL